ncbi:sulfotransferase family protein [Shewanella morhuae]|uniref:sulfotransferase family protein n=1 Tax=Shewanella morhuae TaxID=365591 RepID=UPI001BBFC5A4|nr:sulfotransferase [Shewanella morhuae]GIU04507.1 hypothetical protein TUM4641_12750 [Shewanella morhuae]
MSACFDRPIIILSAPRSGSTLLFEVLSQNTALCTIGGESHAVIETIPELNVAIRGFHSNALTQEDATTDIIQQLQEGFTAQLRHADGSGVSLSDAPIRFLEKTPKNSLRIDFLNQVFPDALFIYLVRDPKENISSIMEAWRSNRFVTYPQLPGFGDWSLLLPANWAQQKGNTQQEIAAFQWQQANDAIMASLLKLPKSRWHLLTYADLVAKPSQQLAAICQFCDIPFDSSFQQICATSLPYSRYTVSAPTPNKWLTNAAAIQHVFPEIKSTLRQINQLLVERAIEPLSEEGITLKDHQESIDPKVLYQDISRNALCPCHSGKRYKHCHGTFI